MYLHVIFIIFLMQLQCSGNSASDNGACNCFNSALNAYEQDNKEQWIGSSKTGSNILDVICIEEEHYQGTHKQQCI